MNTKWEAPISSLNVEKKKMDLSIYQKKGAFMLYSQKIYDVSGKLLKRYIYCSNLLEPSRKVSLIS